MTEDERNKKLEESGKEYRFQPGHEVPREAISKGVREALAYKKMREEFYTSITGIKIKGADNTNFWDVGAKKLQQLIFSATQISIDCPHCNKHIEKVGVRLSEKEQAALFLKILNGLPRDDKLTIDPGFVGNVVFYLPEKDKEDNEGKSYNDNNEQKVDSDIKNASAPAQETPEQKKVEPETST